MLDSKSPSNSIYTRMNYSGTLIATGGRGQEKWNIGLASNIGRASKAAGCTNSSNIQHT